MTKILDWRRTEDPRDVIHTAVQALAEGHLVAFPNDGHYIIAASGLRNQSIGKLRPLMKGSNASAILPGAFLMMRSIDEVFDYSPNVSALGVRIGRRCWPGPIDLVFENTHPRSLLNSLPSEVREIVLENGYFGLSCPRHEAIQQVAKLIAGPLVLIPAFRPERMSVARSVPNSDLACASPNARQKDARQEEMSLVVEPSQVSRDVAFVVDSGPIERVGLSRLVRVQGNRCEILREGLMTAENLSASTSFTILVVCTGNTCRSPMAEAMLRSKLMRRFEKELLEGQTRFSTQNESETAASQARGQADTQPPTMFRVVSAGVAAQPGGPASDGALQVMQERGMDLDDHQSRSVSQGLLERSDLVLTMTSNHRQAILSRWPQVSSKTFCLAPTGGEVSDPYGGTVDAYRKCADLIDQFLDNWIEKLDTNLFPNWIKNN